MQEPFRYTPKTDKEKEAFKRYKRQKIEERTQKIMQRLDKKLTVLLVFLSSTLVLLFVLGQETISYQCDFARPGARVSEIFMFTKSPFSWDGMCKMMTKKNGRFLAPVRLEQSQCEERMHFYRNKAGCKKIKRVEEE